MKMTSSIALNLDVPRVTREVENANKQAMRDTVVAVTHEAVHQSPWLTGNNRRSIAGEVSGMGSVATGGEGRAERLVDDSKIEGAVYSTSGYGGFLETGTSKMPARPYIKPAMDKNFTIANYTKLVKEHLE